MPSGVIIALPEVPLFFGNADGVFATLRTRVKATAALQRIVLSLEESPDLDTTSIEALRDFAQWTPQRGSQLALARVKDTVRDLLGQVRSGDLPAAAYAPWSVDDAMQLPSLPP